MLVCADNRSMDKIIGPDFFSVLIGTDFPDEIFWTGPENQYHLLMISTVFTIRSF